MDNVSLYLTEQETTFPELADLYSLLRDYLSKKLYYQFSTKLIDILKIPFFLANDTLYRFYKNVVRPVEDKLEPFFLSRFVLELINVVPEGEERNSLLENTAKIVAKDPASSFLISLGELKENLLTSNKEDIAEQLEAKGETLSENGSKFDDEVFVFFFRLLVQFHQHWKNSAQFLEAARGYLKHADLSSELSPKDQLILAQEICFAVLIGKVFVFSDILDNELIKSLECTDSSWLVECIRLMSEGDVKEFERLITSYSSDSNAEKAAFFIDHKENLSTKVRKMALLKMCSEKSVQRTNEITFGEAANTCLINENLIEFLVIEAVCDGIIEAKIDEVAKTLFISWVLPQKLSDVSVLCRGIKEWALKVENVPSAAKRVA